MEKCNHDSTSYIYIVKKYTDNRTDKKPKRQKKEK